MESLVPPLFDLMVGDPARALLAVALHHGDAVRPEVEPLLALGEAARRAEEDPLTGTWAEVSPNRIIARRSRFEVDLNRPPEQAVYLNPEDAWGLHVWQARPPRDVVRRSLAEHARFYRAARETLGTLLARHRRVLVLDLHSYNHRRGGPDAPAGDPAHNPDLNVGTGTMNRARWAPVVDAFLDAARGAAENAERPRDVRENVRFRGGYFAGWAHRAYPENVCVLALEVKKTFMDEHEGSVDLRELVRWREIVRAGASAALETMEASA